MPHRRSTRKKVCTSRGTFRGMSKKQPLKLRADSNATVYRVASVQHLRASEDGWVVSRTPPPNASHHPYFEKRTLVTDGEETTGWFVWSREGRTQQRRVLKLTLSRLQGMESGLTYDRVEDFVRDGAQVGTYLRLSPQRVTVGGVSEVRTYSPHMREAKAVQRRRREVGNVFRDQGLMLDPDVLTPEESGALFELYNHQQLAHSSQLSEDEYYQRLNDGFNILQRLG